MRHRLQAAGCGLSVGCSCWLAATDQEGVCAAWQQVRADLGSRAWPPHMAALPGMHQAQEQPQPRLLAQQPSTPSHVSGAGLHQRCGQQLPPGAAGLGMSLSRRTSADSSTVADAAGAASAGPSGTPNICTGSAAACCTAAGFRLARRASRMAIAFRASPRAALWLSMCWCARQALKCSWAARRLPACMHSLIRHGLPDGLEGGLAGNARVVRWHQQGLRGGPVQA